jgi:hypothetical protein
MQERKVLDTMILRTHPGVEPIRSVVMAPGRMIDLPSLAWWVERVVKFSCKCLITVTVLP